MDKQEDYTLVGPDGSEVQRSHDIQGLAVTDTPDTQLPGEAGHTLFYALRADGGLVTRDGRALFATAEEWGIVPKVGTLVPVDASGPMFGALPLVANGAPDIIGRVADLMVFLEKAATSAVTRVELIEQQLSRRIHERELLRRAAEYVDPEIVGDWSYEARLDWIAKYREVTS